MLRNAIIACLVVLNVTVWLGPAETLMARSGDTYGAVVMLEQVDDLVAAGDLGGALRTLHKIVEAYPDNSAYHYELGAFQHMHADFLSQNENMNKADLARAAQEQLRRARDLAPEDIHLASNYAVRLMDVEFFGGVIERKKILEAWDRVRTLTMKRQHSVAEQYYYANSVANVLIQQARVEARFGNRDAALALIDEARSFSPHIRIPRTFFEQNAVTTTP